MSELPKEEICARLRQIRIETCGPRGKSSFAHKIGISASTYDYYESGRVPPVGVLRDVSDLSGICMDWLVNGRGPLRAVPCSENPVIRRAVRLLAKHPNATEALAVFLDVLNQSMQFPPKKKREIDETARPALTKKRPDHKTWIPVLGRSAAGVPHFWANGEDAAGTTKLQDLIERHANQPGGMVFQTITETDENFPNTSIQIVTLINPKPGGLSEFVAAAHIKSQWPDTFGMRIDGESMSPEIRHSDLVLLSPSVPAVDGQAAVVQLVNQIGVTCKLYYLHSGKAHLVPINEHFDPLSFPADRVVWALRVLKTIHPE